MIKKDEVKSKMLTPEQVEVLRDMIIDSMRGVYVNSGALPPNDFDSATGFIADKVIKNSQERLLQKNVFKKIINEKEVVKKPKKNARK